MCGITGLVNWGNPGVLDEMNSIQVHRGPDDFGACSFQTRNERYVGLASRRLAIQDLSPAGHMPMRTADGRFTIVYNGEIYNYPQLRGELEASGHRLRSHCDTEAILLLFQEHGSAMLTKLNGMFAIAIWDAEREELFLARDHVGIKPLYYCRQGDRLAFASEAKALFLVPGVERSLDRQALRPFLTFLWVPEPATMFAGIAKLPAGHFARFRDGELRVEEYWDLAFPDIAHRYPTDERELERELRERFEAAVASQLLSDVPVGAFLSAGLDSSSIVAVMAARSRAPVKTFTVGFPPEHRAGEMLDDMAVAKRTADHFHCDHTEIVVRPDVADLLPKLVWHMDDPTADPAIITAYLVCKEAKPHATVMLSGVGGDEVFAGYRKYRAHQLAERYRRLPEPLRRRMIEPLVAQLPSLSGTRYKGRVRLLKKMARSASLPPTERFITDSKYLSESDLRELLIAPPDGSAPSVGSSHLAAFDRAGHADFLNQMLYVDSKTFMASLNLNYNDKMSMASSVEVRVPFLDRELMEWVATNVPPDAKLHAGQTKHVLREALRPILPAEVLRQPKAGFGAPIDVWLAKDLREMVDDLLSPSAVAERGIFRPETVRRLISDQRSGRRDRSYPVWSLLTLELWMRQFIDGHA